jgi:hypothetical protein
MVRFPVRCGVNIQAFAILNRLPMRRIIISGQTRSFYAAKDNGDVAGFDERKKIMKYRGFKIVSDQTGNIFNPDVFTMVWARRFAGYKRADLLGRSGAFSQTDGKRKISDPDYLGRKALSIGLSGNFDFQSLGRRKQEI